MSSLLIVLFLVALAAAGLVGLVLSWKGFFPALSYSNFLTGTVIVGFGIACVVGWASGLFSLALASFVLTLMIPKMVESRREEKQRLETLSAVAAFSQSLSDAIGGGSSLSSALVAACKKPPRAIHDHTVSLSIDLQQDSLESAVTEFVQKLDSPASDLLGAHLLQASTFGSGRLKQVLRKVTKTLNAYILTTKKIEISRRRQLFEVRGLTVIIVCAMGGLLISGSDFLMVYKQGISGDIKMGVVLLIAFSAWLFTERFSRGLQQDQFRLKFDEVEV